MKKLLALLLIATMVSSCLDVGLSSDFVNAKCNTAKTIVWVKNNCQETVNVNIQSRDLEDFVIVSNGIGVIKPNEIKHTEISFFAPDDFTGMREGTLVVNGIEKSISIMYSACENEINKGYQTNTYSAISYSANEPTEYKVYVKGWDSCRWIKAGANSLPIMLENAGATGDFNFEIEGDVAETNAYINRNTGVLRRGESGTIYLNMDIAEEDQYYLVLVISHGGNVVAEKEICLKVEGIYSASIIAPQMIEVKDCEIKTVNYSVKNTGTKSDTYSISDNFGTKIIATIESRQEKAISVNVNGKTAFDYLNINVSSQEIEGSANIAILKKACVEQVVTSEADTLAKEVKITVTNPKNTTIDNVTVQVTGVPDGWKVFLPDATTLGPNEQKELTAWVIPTTDEEADVSVVAKSGNEILATTGMFLAKKNEFSWNYVIILAVIIGATVALLYLPKGEKRANLDTIKREITKSIPDEIKKMPEQKD